MKKGEIDLSGTEFREEDEVRLRSVVRQLIDEDIQEGKYPLLGDRQYLLSQADKVHFAIGIEAFEHVKEGITRKNLPKSERFGLRLLSLTGSAQATWMKGEDGATHYVVTVVKKGDEEKLIHEIKHIADIITYGPDALSKDSQAGSVLNIFGMGVVFAALPVAHFDPEVGRSMAVTGLGIMAFGRITYSLSEVERRAEEAVSRVIK